MTNVVTLEWHGPFTFKELVTSEEHWGRFRTPGVYLWMEDETAEVVHYVGMAGGRETIMTRLLRHYLGHVGCLYYLEPKLRSGKRSNAAREKFRVAAAMLRDESAFLEHMRKEFALMDRYRVYLASCQPEAASVVESILIKVLLPKANRRKERKGFGAELSLRHIGSLPPDPKLRTEAASR